MAFLTDFILDLGRTVAYYPQLKKITGSTTSSILLCQLLYWTGKTKNKDGWIYKTSADLEEETGLTYFEQKTARATLVQKGFIEEQYRRLDHQIVFRVRQDVINAKWQALINHTEEPVIESKPEEEIQPALPIELPPVKEVLKPVEVERHTDATKKGDLVDGHLAYLTSSANVKVNALYAIKTKLEKKFHIICDDKKWEKFINFVYTRETKFNEPVDKFIAWALDNGFDPMYWSPEKMKTMYPQAFVTSEAGYRDDFVDEPVMTVGNEKEIVPMPKEMTRKKNLN